MKFFPVFFITVMTAVTLQAAPKKLLMVTTTTSFRHTSIPNLEKVVEQLGKTSGEFTVDFVRQPPGEPQRPKQDASDEEKAAYNSARAVWLETLRGELNKLSLESLMNYDGVVFASTTGDLPIPDMQGLIDWIKAGHSFIGIHAASDTFHRSPEFFDMLGGEFEHHGPQVGVEYVNQEPKHPATAYLGNKWSVQKEEIYQFKHYDPAKVTDLLIFDKNPETNAPGHFPASWCKQFGAGKVFYTAIGHREDIIDASPDLKDRRNPVETSLAYQKHVLGGIEWTLGLAQDK
ncbi:MAG: ThuA domain-containing protein [Verrucomicrobiota bacterium]